MNEHETVLNLAQTLLQSEYPSGDVPREKIGPVVRQAMSVCPKLPVGFDKDRVIEELESRFNIWIGDARVLEDNTDHIQWLDATRMDGWRYWPRYRRTLEKGPIGPASTESIDKVTNSVLRRLEDPNREGQWDRRGMVVGHVQSGKTATYVGLMCKAADAGYKVIIVLAGMHNNLRSQTQLRIEDGFLGYETLPKREPGRLVGVGLENRDPELRPDCATHREEKGDLNKTVVRNLTFHPGGRPLVFVVKKNGPVLRNLLSWIDRVADMRDPDTGQGVLSNTPLLIIDDEADHASVDTGDQQFSEDGVPDPDHEPKAINRLIRKIVKSFYKSAYVGFTATPFANIFIHKKGSTKQEGEDLFPRSFIVNLPAPSNYIGPARVFGLDADDIDGESVKPLRLVREVKDHAKTPQLNETEGWIPPRHKSDHRAVVDGKYGVPQSLFQAMLSFLITGAARRVRGQRNVHNSMLVHVTRFTAVQRQVADQLRHALSMVRNEIRFAAEDPNDSIIRALRDLWYRDYEPTSEWVRKQIDDPKLTSVTWREVREELVDFVEDVWITGVREINGSAGDILDYEECKKTGLNIIAVGGDKLSRGLTLEGLTVSYFLRATRMYDTLMQMGRWFGYRDGCIDFCRLYMTIELSEWFQHIAKSSEELRQEFDHMHAVGGTPAQYGLRVRAHPVLLVTSRIKMRNHQTLRLSFAGTISETVVFHAEGAVRISNEETVSSFLGGLGPPRERNPVRERGRTPHKWTDTYVWHEVKGADVGDLLRQYTTHPDAIRVNGNLLADYIEKQVARDELMDWTVALISGGEGGPDKINDLNISLVKRSRNERSIAADDQKRAGKFIIRRLLSARDEAIDMGPQQYQSALTTTIEEWTRDPGRSRRKTVPTEPSGSAIRRVRDKRKGLLLIYPVDPVLVGLEGNTPVYGLGISFPDTRNAEKVEYKVNNVYWEQEHQGW